MRRAATMILLIATGVAVLAGGLLAAGYIYEAQAEARDARTVKPAGRLVDVGGRRMHIVCKGQGEGPTVVLEAGGGNSAMMDQPLQDRIAAFARVCAYDRAGLGWSDPAGARRSFEDRAADLDALLAAARIPGPYVLVGESFGGLLARDYARLHPDKVAGMVLVDAAEEVQVFASLTPKYIKSLNKMADRNALLSRFGLLRLAASRELARYPSFDEETRRAIVARTARPAYWRTVADEVAAYDLTPPERRKAGGFGGLGDRPLVVIRRGRPLTGVNAAFEAGWPEAQARLAALSTDSREIYAENNGHGICQENPDLVAGAVREVVRKVHGMLRDVS